MAEENRPPNVESLQQGWQHDGYLMVDIERVGMAGGGGTPVAGTVVGDHGQPRGLGELDRKGLPRCDAAQAVMQQDYRRPRSLCGHDQARKNLVRSKVD